MCGLARTWVGTDMNTPFSETILYDHATRDQASFRHDYRFTVLAGNRRNALDLLVGDFNLVRLENLTAVVV
jgi:hypothetical protein